MLLDGAIKAYNRVGLMLNVRREDLDKVLATLPVAAQSHHRAVERSRTGWPSTPSSKKKPCAN